MAFTLAENDSGVSSFTIRDNKSSIHRLSSSNRPSNEMATNTTTTAASSIAGDNRKSVSSQKDLTHSSSRPSHTRNESIDIELERGLKLDDLRSRRAQELPPTTSSTNQDGPSNLNSPSGANNGQRATGDSASSIHSGSSTAWDPSHPCYPHTNPHVPPNSTLAASTRIIRIPRDFMIHGDISPAFSNTYPKILEPYMDEERFRRVVKTINDDLFAAFNPWNWRHWVDTGVGVLTGWVSEDLFGTETKRRLRRVEEFLEAENVDMERCLEMARKGEMVGSRQGESRGTEGGVMLSGLATLIPLRRTGYMNLDIQIPNPFTADSEYDEDERSVGTPADYSAQPTPRETSMPVSPKDQLR